MNRLSTLSRRERRVVLGGVSILAVAVLGLRGIPAWRTWMTDTRAVADISIAELARTRAGIAAMPALRDSLIARNERYLALAPSILTGTSSGAVGASLASVVSGAAAGAGLELGALSIRPDTTRTAAFSLPSVRGDARGDITGLTRFLVALERGPTILVIRQLAITQPEPGAGSDRPETLRIEFTVEGLALARPATEPSVASVAGDSARAARARGIAP
jgi:hypothetical protein